MRTLPIAATLLFVTILALGEELPVKIVNRQNNETEYTYVVPAFTTSNSNTSVNCAVDPSNVNCNASTRTTATTVPAHQLSYRVRGATFALQLPDGRVAIVNCESKFAEHFAGPAGNHRSCRMPLVDDIKVDFSGAKAKLKWPVSLDGKKIESETYKILGVLAK